MQNKLQYHAVVFGEHEDPIDIMPYFVGTVMPLWQACISNNAFIIDITVSTNHPTGIPPYAPVSSPQLAAGTQTGDAASPYEQATILKLPDAVNCEPPEAASRLRYGAIRIGGIAEVDMANGLAQSGLISDLNALGEALEGFTISGTEYQMHYGGEMLVIDSDPPEFFPYAVPVAETVARTRLGTQNTRKF